MKKILASIAIVCMTSLLVNAQGKSAKGNSNKQVENKQKLDPTSRATKITNEMATNLALSEDQKAKVMTINLERAQKNQALMEKKKAVEQEIRDARKKNHQEREEALKAVLTPDQLLKYTQKKKKNNDDDSLEIE